MGILGFMDWLRKYCPEAIGVVPLSCFRGLSIDIDAHYWMYENLSVIRKKMIDVDPLINLEPNEAQIDQTLFKAVLDFAKSMLEHGVTPTFVFDGDAKYDPKQDHVNLSAAKEKTILARREKRKERRDRIAVIKALLSNLDPLSGEDKALKAEYRTLLGGLVELNGPRIQGLKEILMSVGVSCLQARYDGEQLCSMRARERKCSAVFSNDTDNIVYGCPVLITRFARSDECLTATEAAAFSKEKSCEPIGCKRVKTCIIIDNRILEKKLKDDNITREMFVDFCITCKCDYNEKLAGVGAISAFKLIKKYGCIEKYPNTYDTKTLNYELCRKIFLPVSSSSTLVSPKSCHLPFGATDSKNNIVFVPRAVAEGAFGHFMKYELTDYVTWYNKIYERWDDITGNNDKKTKGSLNIIVNTTSHNKTKAEIEGDGKLKCNNINHKSPDSKARASNNGASNIIDLISGVPKEVSNKIVIKILS